jgi:lysozyme
MDILELLETEEGFRATVYKDSLGLLTIGIGRCVDPSIPGAGLTREEAEYLLANDVRRVMVEAGKTFPWFAGLDLVRQTTVAALVFQLGLPRFLDFHRTIEAIAAKNWQAAHDELLDSRLAAQAPARTKRMALQLLPGEWQE